MTAALESAILDAIEDEALALVEEEAERRVRIAAEVDEGRSFGGASRALFDHEVRAEVLFADIATDHDLAEEEIVEAVDVLHAAAVAALLAAVLGGERGAPSTAAVVSERLRAVRRAWPPALVLAVEEAAESLARVFGRAAERGAATAAAEAARQGLDVAAPLGVLDSRKAREAASQVADTLVDRLLLAGATATDTIRPGPASASVVGERLRGAVTDASVKQVVDDARQITHHAYGEGRMATADALPEPVGIYASELLDGDTCDSCARVDGREYADVEAAMEDYPAGGPYWQCHGGSRCRGTLVFEWV